jgi:ankyrin repeat protein
MRRAIEQLIKKNANVKTINKDERTPLYDVARSSSKDKRRVIRQLIKKNANVKAINKNERTPLYDVAQSSSKVAILQILLDTS